MPLQFKPLHRLFAAEALLGSRWTAKFANALREQPSQLVTEEPVIVFTYDQFIFGPGGCKQPGCCEQPGC